MCKGRAQGERFLPQDQGLSLSLWKGLFFLYDPLHTWQVCNAHPPPGNPLLSKALTIFTLAIFTLVKCAKFVFRTLLEGPTKCLNLGG